MCGIAGFITNENTDSKGKAVQTVFNQLKLLEYRGYDSAGIAYIDNHEIKVIKKAGRLTELEKLVPNTPASNIAIGHSRWATHGAPTDLNAHPHYDRYEHVVIIHNGIIENYLEIKNNLAQEGHTFYSDTDSEVIAHLIGKEHSDGTSLEEAVKQATKVMRGAYGIVAISKKDPDKIVAAKMASPIVIGVTDTCSMVASDIPALLPYTKKVVILEDGDIATLYPNNITIIDKNGEIKEPEFTEINWDIKQAEKGGYEHFMLKEIHETPEVINQCLSGRIDEKNIIRLEQVFSQQVWGEIERVTIVGCGTAYHAGLMGKYLFEQLLRIPTDVYNASEFRYSQPVLSSKTLAVIISQSGETADTLAALKLCKENRIRTLGIVNVVGSSIARECDKTLFIQAGPEISVASTKAYTAQVMVLILLTLHVAQIREMPGVKIPEALLEIRQFSDKIKDLLLLEDDIRDLAKIVKDSTLLFYTGRGIDYYAALEGALKIKEIAYMHTQECSSGELKHGPLALVEKGVTGIFLSNEKQLNEKLASNIKEFKARDGQVVCLASYLCPQIANSVDKYIQLNGTKCVYLDAILSSILLQLLAYYTAKELACDIDKPRNLAKSVTVE